MEIVRHLFILITVGLSVYGTFILDRQFDGDIAFIWPVDGVLVSLLLLLSKKKLHVYAATGTLASGVISALLFGTPPLLKACMLLVIYLQAVGIVRLMEAEKNWMAGTDDGLKGWLRFAMYGLLGIPLAASAASVALRQVWIEENVLITLRT